MLGWELCCQHHAINLLILTAGFPYVQLVTLLNHEVNVYVETSMSEKDKNSQQSWHVNDSRSRFFTLFLTILFLRSPQRLPRKNCRYFELGVSSSIVRLLHTSLRDCEYSCQHTIASECRIRCMTAAASSAVYVQTSTMHKAAIAVYIPYSIICYYNSPHILVMEENYETSLACRPGWEGWMTTLRPGHYFDIVMSDTHVAGAINIDAIIRPGI